MSNSKRLLAILVFLFCAQQGRAIAVVQHKNNQGVGTQIVVTPTAAITLGNFVAVLVYEDASNAATLSASDANSQTWLTASTVTSGNSVTGLFYKENSAAISAVNCNSTTSATVACYVYEFSGIASSSSIDGIATSSGSTSTTSLASGTITTTQASTVLIYGVGQAVTQSGAWTNGGGFTIDSAPNPNSRDNMQYKIVGSVQTATSTTMTFASAGADRGGVFAAFSATSVGAGCSNHISLMGAGC